MSVRTISMTLGAAVIALVVHGGAIAEEPTLLTKDVNALIKRLEAAESKIESLQDEIKTRDGSSTRLTAFEDNEGQFLQPISTNNSLGDNGQTSNDQPISHSSSAALFERLDDLESRWQKQEAENKKFSAAIKRAVQPGTPGSTIVLFGRIHGDFWTFPGDSRDAGIVAFEGGDPEDRFVFRRARIGVKGKIQDNMIYKIEMEFDDPNDSQYRDVFIGWTDLPFLQKVQVGNQKRPYGLDHLNSSRFNVFMERPFIVEAFNQDARRLGIVSYGVSENEAWNWRYGIYNMELTQNDQGYIDDSYQGEVAGRIANTWWYDESSGGRGYGHWAVSGTAAQPNGGASTPETQFRTRPEARSTSRWLDTGAISDASHFQLLGLEALLNVGAFQIVGELENVWMQRNAGKSDLHFWGGYTYVSYFLTGEHIPWDRKTGTLGRVKPFENFFLVDRCKGGTGCGWGAWQIAARYSYADLSNDDVLGGEGESLTFGLNWHWNPNSRMQFNYIHGTITNHAAVNGQTAGNYDILGTRFMVDF